MKYPIRYRGIELTEEDIKAAEESQRGAIFPGDPIWIAYCWKFNSLPPLTDTELDTLETDSEAVAGAFSMSIGDIDCNFFTNILKLIAEVREVRRRKAELAEFVASKPFVSHYDLNPDYAKYVDSCGYDFERGQEYPLHKCGAPPCSICGK